MFKQIPGLVRLPLKSTDAPSQYRMLDLTPLSNTNPFTAPFGVENPGKYLFTNLPVGAQTVGGVPFRIIDPAKNKDRGIVVLHSSRALTTHNNRCEVVVSQKSGPKPPILLVLYSFSGIFFVLF